MSDEKNSFEVGSGKVMGNRGLSLWCFHAFPPSVAAYLALISFVSAALLISLPAISGEMEGLFMGMGKCNLDKVVVVQPEFLDKSGIQTPEYIKKLRKITEVNGVARFAVQDSYFGLKAMYIDIPVVLPRDDNQVWRIFFNEKYSEVKAQLSKALRISFPEKPIATKQYLAGNTPAIMIEKSTGRPYVACRKTELGE
jgi:hypothetical protein